MENWRKLSTTTMEWKDSKDYDKKEGMEVPFSATFTGDKPPTSGDPSQKEVEDYKKQNKEFSKDVKSETKNLSPIFNRKESVEEHMKNLDKKTKTTSSSNNWREILGAVDFKSKPDGTVEINYTQENEFESTEELGEGIDTGEGGLDYQPAGDTAGQSQPSYQTGDDVINTESFIRGKIVELSKTSAKVDLFLETGKSSITEWPISKLQHLNPNRRLTKKEWIIKEAKVGERKLRLVGMECKDRVGIEIRELSKEGSRVIDNNRIDKNGHAWGELVNQAVWESRFDRYIKR